MKCSKCDKQAVIRIPYANLYLCQDHLNEWIESRVERTMKKYNMLHNVKRVAVAVSGGKDSTSLLHVMHRLSQRLGFEVIGVTIDLGIDAGTRYSSKSVEMAVKNFEMLKVPYRVVNLKREYGFTIEDAKRGIRRPVCSSCGLAKRYVLSVVAEEEKADALATGHNLNDVAQFVMTGYYSGDVENLARLEPVSPPKFYSHYKVKPFFLTYEKEIMTFALVNRIPFIVESCPFSWRVGGATQEAVRRKLEELEEAVPGFMLRLVESFADKIRGPLAREYIKEEEVSRCKICGRPTTKGREICSFCAMRMKLTGVVRA
ncbi:MAG: ATP-binding protein [Thermoprotei archaeon]